MIVLDTSQLPPELSREVIETIPVQDPSTEEMIQMFFKKSPEEEQVKLNISPI